MDRVFIKCLLYKIKVESKDMSLKEYVSLSLCLKNMSLIMSKEYVTTSFTFLCYYVLKNMSPYSV